MTPDQVAAERRSWDAMMSYCPEIIETRRNLQIARKRKQAGKKPVIPKWMISESEATARSWKLYKTWLDM